MRRRDEFAEVFGASDQIVTIERWQVLATTRMGLSYEALFGLLQPRLGGFRNTAWRLRPMRLGAHRGARSATGHLTYRAL